MVSKWMMWRSGWPSWLQPADPRCRYLAGCIGGADAVPPPAGCSGGPHVCPVPGSVHSPRPRVSIAVGSGLCVDTPGHVGATTTSAGPDATTEAPAPNHVRRAGHHDHGHSPHGADRRCHIQQPRLSAEGLANLKHPRRCGPGTDLRRPWQLGVRPLLGAMRTALRLRGREPQALAASLALGAAACRLSLPPACPPCPIPIRGGRGGHGQLRRPCGLCWIGWGLPPARWTSG